MYLELALSYILLRNLRKEVKLHPHLAGWDKIFIACYFIAAALILLPRWAKEYETLIFWAGHVFIISLVSIVFIKKEFYPVKQVAYALIPTFLFSIVEDVIALINNDIYEKWDKYFEVASVSALVWMIAMLMVNSRQKKALEKERLKAEELEKERKIAESMKAVLEVQVKERTAEITKQKEELQKALDDLKQVQKQLVQSEKMASLGELTAGIAHEIQNPLNFVNNFSDVNKELLTEMKEEIEKGNYEEVKALAKDIIDNEEKINHHGKRADGIVKGMLQHSRTSSGQKEATSINALCDEYLRLSYHGLRAKDKSFNATFETDFDESIEKINIVGQDIGRVILNLINNAFYAVNERAKKSTTAFRPTVTVSTKKLPGKIQIIIKDNGTGIPHDIIEKIFQPFFTTKPTGQGTGLGLSLSFDIITKGHGGELKVESKENEGTSFIILLPA